MTCNCCGKTCTGKVVHQECYEDLVGEYNAFDDALQSIMTIANAIRHCNDMEDIKKFNEQIIEIANNALEPK